MDLLLTACNRITDQPVQVHTIFVLCMHIFHQPTVDLPGVSAEEKWQFLYRLELGSVRVTQ